MLRLLRSQKTGIYACFATVALLAVGSVTADRVPEAYAGLSLDDLRFFFEPARLIHWWFYAVCLVLALWATSAVVAAWDGVVLRLRSRLPWTAWGTVILHLGFPLALLGHLIGGLWATTAVHQLGPGGVAIAGSAWRVAAVEEELHPDGGLRMLTATLEERPLDGAGAGAAPAAPARVRVGYNQPVFRALGAWELLLLRHFPVPGAVLRGADGIAVALAPGDRGVVGGRVVRLGRVLDHPSLRAPVAEVFVEFPERGRHVLALGDALPDGALAFAEARGTPVLLLMERWNPSIPIVIGVALLAVVGVVLAGADRLRRRGR